MHQCAFHIVNASVGAKNVSLSLRTSGYGNRAFEGGHSRHGVPNVHFKDIEKTLGWKINAALIDCEGCIKYVDPKLFYQLDLLIMEEDAYDVGLDYSK